MTVRRSAFRMWLLAMGGIALLIISLDVLTNRRISDWLRGILFSPQATQLYEPRDVIWAWAMALFGGGLVLWGLKELFAPTKVVECTEKGLALRVVGPLRPPLTIPWERIVDITGEGIEDEGTQVPLLVVELRSRDGVPANPWGAGWVGESKLGMVAEDWPEPPQSVAEKIADYAVEAVKGETRSRTSRLWGER